MIRCRPRSEIRRPQVLPRQSGLRFHFLPIFIGLGAILCLIPQILGQDLPPTANPEHYTTKRTWMPTEPMALNDEGVVIGKDFVIYKDRSVQLLGPIGKGGNSVLVAVNNKGQVLVAQAYNGLYYFVYDPVRNDMTPIGLNAQVQEDGTLRNIRLGYLTGLDDNGRVFGVYGSGHGPCGVVGTPTYGKPGELKAPPEPAMFTLLGCPGAGDLHIRAINSKGQMTGGVSRLGFLWSNGKTSLFKFPGSWATEGVAINGAGVVAGVFSVGNAISENGEVSGKFVPGLPPPQKGFTYDGTQFRLLFLQRGTPIDVRGINNRGQITGHYDAGGGDNKGFVINSATLPIAHMEATAAELTAAEAERRQVSSPASADGSSLDRAYRILRDSNSLSAASTLRALQALEATGPLGRRKRVPDVDSSGSVDVGTFVSVEALHTRLIEETLNGLMLQFGAAQRTEVRRKGLVDAVATLGGDEGLQELRDAGELAPEGPATLSNPENQVHAIASAKFKNMIRSAIAADLSIHPLEIPPRDLDLWQASQMSPREIEALDKTLRRVKEQLGTQAAEIFLAWNEVRNSGIGGLFGWHGVEQLIGLNTRGERVQAEQVYRALAEIPEPAKCPGLEFVKASGTDQDDMEISYRPINPRAQLASALIQMGDQTFREIYDQPKQPAAVTASTSPNDVQAAWLQTPAKRSAGTPPAPILREIANHIASPAGIMFSGSNATLKDGVVTFTLKAPNDKRNGQTLSFKGLIPLPGHEGKAWITDDDDGYVVFSTVVPGMVMGQVLPKSAGEPVYEKAVNAQKKGK